MDRLMELLTVQGQTAGCNGRQATPTRSRAPCWTGERPESCGAASLPSGSFAHLEVVGTRVGVVLHLDRQRSRLDALVFVVDLGRRPRAFFGRQVQAIVSYLVPAGLNPRPGVSPGDSNG